MRRRAFLKAALGVVGAALLPIPSLLAPKPTSFATIFTPGIWADVPLDAFESRDIKGSSVTAVVITEIDQEARTVTYRTL